MKLEEIEKEIIFKVEPIRVRGLLRKRKESLEEFLKKFLKKWNIDNETVYLKNQEIQTAPGKRRSFGDIYMICKYYYPECNLETVAKLLYKTFFDEIEGFRSSYCNTIKKRVWYIDVDDDNALLNKKTKDEFSLDVSDWLKLLDININEINEEIYDDDDEN